MVACAAFVAQAPRLQSFTKSVAQAPRLQSFTKSMCRDIQDSSSQLQPVGFFTFKRHGLLPAYSVRMPASLITLPILAISALMKAANSAGELLMASTPKLNNLSFSSGLVSTRTNS